MVVQLTHILKFSVQNQQEAQKSKKILKETNALDWLSASSAMKKKYL